MKRIAAALIVGLAVSAVASAASLRKEPEPEVTTISPEVRPLERSGGACPFESLSLLSVHAGSLPVFPRQWVNGCGYLQHQGLRIESLVHDGPHGAYRLQYVKRADQTPQQFIVYLVGGPRARISGAGRAPLQMEPIIHLADQPQTGVLTPAYLGTWGRSFFPRADVAAAGEEVQSLMARVGALHPRSDVRVVSESAGTLVALRVLRQRAVPTVLTIPLVTSIQDFFADRRGTDVSPDAASRPMQFYRYRAGSDELEEVTATGEQQLFAFAGEDRDKSLADLIAALPPSRRACLAIVYGSDDRRVRNARLADVRTRFPSIPIRAIEGMGHGPANEEQAAALARAVMEVMPARCT